MVEGLRAIDWYGSFAILALTLMLLLGLDFGGETFPWKSAKVICLIVFGALCSLLFVFCEKRLAKYPLMPLSLFKNVSNVAALVVTFTHGFVGFPPFLSLFFCVHSTDQEQVFIASEYYLPLYFQSVQQASPMRSGVLVLPLIIIEALMGFLAGILIHMTGRYREIIWFGMLLATLGNGLYIMLGESSSLGQIVGFQIVMGLGSGLIFEPPVIAVQSMTAQRDTAAVTAAQGFIRNLATSASIVIGGVIFQNSMGQQVPKLRAAGLPNSLVDELSGDLAAAGVRTIKSIKDPIHLLAVKRAYSQSLRNMWIFYTAMSACGLLASFFIRRRKLSKKHTETRTGLRREKPQEGDA